VNDQSLALALCHDLPSDLPPGTYVATEKSTLVTQEFRVLAWKNRWEIPPQIRTGGLGLHVGLWSGGGCDCIVHDFSV
jgi:hypothetical protein